MKNKRPVGQGGKEAWIGTLIEWGPEKTERLGIVHVRPDGAMLHPVNYPQRLWHVLRAAAFTKLFQRDTDSYDRRRREQLFGEPVEIRAAATAA